MDVLLEVQDLVTKFDTFDGVVHALNGVSFDLEDGEMMAIVGESGSGKSVTMMSLLDLLPKPAARIAAGTALFNDGMQTVDLLKLPESEMREVRGGKIGMIFQDPLTSLNPVLTIGEQITESMMQHLMVNQSEARERTIRLLEQVGIPAARHRYKNYPHQFSGGMRQRVMIAIAIACDPKILIADEPTTALDVTVQAQIVELTKNLQAKLGISVIWITHDLGVVAGLAQRVLVMYAGRPIEKALVDDLYEHPQHPYTIGLLGALPKMGGVSDRRLASIEGSPPDLYTEPTHCQFAWRCSFAFERCWQEIPPDINVGYQHQIACFYDVDRGRPREHG